MTPESQSQLAQWRTHAAWVQVPFVLGIVLTFLLAAVLTHRGSPAGGCCAQSGPHTPIHYLGQIALDMQATGGSQAAGHANPA